jgi:Schlafen, AlbA_2
VSTPPPTDRATLDSLLGRSESETLEFKSMLNLRVKRDELGLALDVAALALEGGHIVVGVDNRGTPTGQLSDAQARLLDESRVRPKLERYLPPPVSIHVAEHLLDGGRVVVIYVPPHPDGFVIMNADGHDGERVAFRQGDVFMRHGTSTERWRQSDVGRIKSLILGAPELVLAPPSDHRLGDTFIAEGPPYAMSTVRAIIVLENVGDAVAKIIGGEAFLDGQTTPTLALPSAIRPGSQRPLEVRVAGVPGNAWPNGAVLRFSVDYEGRGRRRRLSAEVNYYKATGWHHLRTSTEEL